MLWRLLKLPFTLMLALSKRVLLALFLLALALSVAATSLDSVFATLSDMVDAVAPGTTVRDRQDRLLAAERSRAEAETKRAEAAVAAAADLRERNAALSQNNDSLSATNTALKQQADTLTQANVALEAQVKALQEAAAKAQVTYQGRTIPVSEAVAEATRQVADRMVAAARRRVATAPGEAIPFYGVPLTAAAASQDVEDACTTLRDLHNLDVAFNPKTALSDEGVCELMVPTAASLWTETQTQAPALWERLHDRFANLPVLVLPPWWDQVMAEAAALLTPMPVVTGKP